MRPVLVVEGRKPCARCAAVKPVEEFQKATKAVSGYSSICKVCEAERTSDRRADKARKEKQRRDANKDDINRRRRENRDPQRAREEDLRTTYNLTTERYDLILASQGGRCAICETDRPGGNGGRYFAVDHDHACCPGLKSCGACVRGLLCANCNMAMGLLRDDVRILEKAARYLISTSSIARAA